MADAVEPSQLDSATACHRWYRSDAWLAVTGLVGAVLALPLAPGHLHAPEAAAVLAIAATALAAGQRWAIGVIVLAELWLVPTIWPRAFFGGEMPARLIALATLAAIVPGVLAMPRAAAALVVMTGQPRTHRACRHVHAVLITLGVIAAALPLVTRA